MAGPWDVGQFAVGFTLSALAACAVVFNGFAHTGMSEVMQIVALAAATVANFVALMLFLRDAFTYKAFVAAKAPTPLLFMKLTHEAFRSAVARLRCAARVLRLIWRMAQGADAQGEERAVAGGRAQAGHHAHVAGAVG